MKKSELVILLCIILFFGAIFVKQQLILNKLNKEYKQYNDQLSKIKMQNEQLNEQFNIMQREDYIEKLARDKLRLIKPGETLFIDKNKKK
ncbi:Septum formation initiator [Caloramator quimbayensis]|uniref:Septum formation initiator n=1 Tax=Caloramator quimbayensis TaxID=1147123 RepID=A0A1T4Y1T3_9CLOT|nr:septum formation initiator family protein [Caloramator quimbayensis]SKA95438.1 Septum formation initiator [Caloramator quimbayensis]